GYAPEGVSYHIMLLDQAGLISADKADYVDGRGEYYYGQNLTWSGHEFIDNAKNQDLWNRVKGAAKEKGVQLSFEAIKKLMSNALDQMLS
ncbi:MAG: DUF2513 domain-containing protein, partial [Desulfuromonadales bacterium]|nr:DUF2513 domain-containing protein [Desulfuromonadales bacterium]